MELKDPLGPRLSSYSTGNPSSHLTIVALSASIIIQALVLVLQVSSLIFNFLSSDMTANYLQSENLFQYKNVGLVEIISAGYVYHWCKQSWLVVSRLVGPKCAQSFATHGTNSH
jgi:hypothetical protein